MTHEFDDRRMGWLQVVRGTAALADQLLSAGDGVAIQELSSVTLSGDTETEILLFDMR